jgi:cation:H+ antiporter
LITAGLFVAGLVALIAGAELLVRGASRLAYALGIAPLVVGLTVVAFGTSAPEIAVSVGAVTRGQVDLAVGNVVGSNVFNVLFILGLSALITPLVVARQLIRQEVPLMIGVSVLLLVFALDGTIGRIEAATLFAGMIAYTVFLIRQGRAEAAAARGNGEPVAASGRGALALNAVFVIVGLALLVLGAGWLVEAAVKFARWLGVSELVIGLTIVAAGTSLPEVASSIVAAIRGERDIAVGNVIGSNLFNILACLGIAGLVAAEPLAVAPSVRTFDLPVMVAVAFVCLPVFFTGASIERWEGGVLFGYYIAYTAYLILRSAEHDALPAFSAVMAGFVIPLTVITLTIVIVRAASRPRSE